MLPNYFTVARIGKNAQVINGKKGDYMSMDVVRNDRGINGEERTQWIRVTSSKPNHINLAKFLTKGKVIIITGYATVDTPWIDKEGNPKSRLKVFADNIDFLNFGKRKVESQQPSGDVAVETKEVAPEAPAQTAEDDLPF